MKSKAISVGIRGVRGFRLVTKRQKVGIQLEKVARLGFTLAALISFVAVGVIAAFILVKGLRLFKVESVADFLFGTKWKPELLMFGLLPSILGTVAVVAVTIAMVAPIGVLTGVYIVYFAPRRIKSVLGIMVELIGSLPSVVFGFFALNTVVPLVREVAGGSGSCIMSAALVLCVMVLPTVTLMTISALEAVPNSYIEGSLALGATKEEGIFCVALPSCSSPVASAIVLALARATGETMAVMMVAGNQAVIPHSLFSGVRTLTSGIALELGYATGVHKDALISCALVLFLSTLVINAISMTLKRRG